METSRKDENQGIFYPKVKHWIIKMIFKKKMKTNETTKKYNTRFIVKGFKQQKNIDYFDT
jgi:hypothetical protein